MDREPRRSAELLKGWALAEGFDRAGVAGLAPSEHGPAFRAWLARGDQSGMEYLERALEKRLDPRGILAGARSALCVALHYYPVSGGAEPRGDLWPRVARYARGRDYHLVMGRRLERLAVRIRDAFPDAATRLYVDTGPVLERELAARAGLGAFGKHTNLLHPEHGSWFLLGELFTTLELTADEPLADPCGTCRRCLDACPTGALPKPYRLDSRKCISYWTIEHRGAIPRALRPTLADWVFGCDLCQEACPWNEAPSPSAEEASFSVPASRAELDLVALLALSPEAYREAFRESPLKRPKLEGLKRNAAVAMGNRAEPRYVPALERCLAEEPDSVVREHAAWALGRIPGSAARRALTAAGGREAAPAVRAEIAASLEESSV